MITLTATNEELACHVLEEVVRKGVVEFCICPGSRNSPFVMALSNNPNAKIYYWFEERSAAYFALGRTRATQRPVAVVTTSGSATAELLPATMEAHYLGLPILLLSADRPRRFRNTGSPQTCEQVGLFSCYTAFAQDVAGSEDCQIENWNLRGPAHLNVCFEEPSRKWSERDWKWEPPLENEKEQASGIADLASTAVVEQFLSEVKYPLAIVTGLHQDERDAIAEFLVWLNIPVILEGTSGLREDVRIRHLRVSRLEKIWEHAERANYPIDGIIRIGGIPVNRIWRDLETEEKKKEVRVCSISNVPFSGLSWTGVITVPLKRFFAHYRSSKTFSFALSREWLSAERVYLEKLEKLFWEEPQAEPSFFYHLSQLLPERTHIFLGNSLPIREWDMGTGRQEKHFSVTASRGIIGIDGQISTFLGLSQPDCENWGIFGDLTALYDMAGPWILPQLEDRKIAIVVMNNAGGQIFWRMYGRKEFLHEHKVHFGPLADLWNLSYERWTEVPETLKETTTPRLIECVPDAESTARFWKKFENLSST